MTNLLSWQNVVALFFFKLVSDTEMKDFQGMTSEKGTLFALL